MTTKTAATRTRPTEGTLISFKGPRTMIWFALAQPSVAYAASKGVKLVPVPGWGARLEGTQKAVEGVAATLTAAWATVGEQLRAWAKTDPEGREDPNIADALKAVELFAEALA